MLAAADWVAAHDSEILARAAAIGNSVAGQASALAGDAIAKADFGFIGNRLKPSMTAGLDQAIDNVATLLAAQEPVWLAALIAYTRAEAHNLATK